MGPASAQRPPSAIESAVTARLAHTRADHLHSPGDQGRSAGIVYLLASRRELGPTSVGTERERAVDYRRDALALTARRRPARHLPAVDVLDPSASAVELLEARRHAVEHHANGR